MHVPSWQNPGLVELNVWQAGVDVSAQVPPTQNPGLVESSIWHALLFGLGVAQYAPLSLTIVVGGLFVITPTIVIGLVMLLVQYPGLV